MVTIPAFVWRRGFVVRALIIGGIVGLCSGLLAFLDSGFAAVAAIVLLIVGPFYGTWMARRMTKYWPESAALSGDERVVVVSAARDGEGVSDTRLADFVVTYARGLRASAEDARLLRWLIVVLLVVAVAMAVVDAVFGSWGNVIASAVYLVALILEVFWWPRRRSTLLANADRAAALSP